MADQDDDKTPAVRKQAIKLKREQRWLVGIIGAAGLCGGSVAVFTETVEAGPVAMIAIGATFFLIAISGVLPTRLKVGENEAEFWEEVGAVIEQVVDQVPADNRAEVLARFATAAPEAIGPSLRAAAYEEMVIQMVREAIDTINNNRQPPDHLQVAVPARTSQADAAVVDPLGGELAIEIKGYSKPLGPELVRRTLSRSGATTANLGFRHRTLLVSRSGLTNAAKDAFERPDSGVVTVQISGPEDTRNLLTAIEQSLTFPK